MKIESHSADTKPYINVTPLIDVLLVLLIIFMVASPLRPAQFKARIPSEPENSNLPPATDTLVVIVNSDRTLSLNREEGLGTIEDATKLSKRLVDVFAQRTAHHAYSPEGMMATNLPEAERIQRSVFIRAPKSMPYGDIMRVIDGVKGAGATPIGLQIDDLN
jgi:biopolymer transport protein ExbD